MSAVAPPATATTFTVAAGCITAVLVSALFLLKRESIKRSKGDSSSTTKDDGKGKKSGSKGIDKSKYPGGRISIYYATQTGTAESFAQQLEREGPDYGFFVHIVDMEDVTEIKQFVQHSPYDNDDDDDDGENKQPSRAIVLAATYGEGEPTDNSASIVQVLKEYHESNGDSDDYEKPFSSASNDDGRGLDYCVFGLGNRQYEHFNAMGIFFDSYFEKLGGNRIYQLGMGDDDADLEADFESWKEQLWTTLQENYHVTNNQKQQDGEAKTKNNDVMELPKCEYEIEYLPKKSTTNGDSMNGDVMPESIPLDQVHGSSRHYFTAVDCPVTMIRELRAPEDGGSTVHMEIDVHSIKEGGGAVSYETADNLGVLPVNDQKVVESVAKSLGYDLDQPFILKGSTDGNHEWHGAPFPMPLTVRECLTRYLDLTSAPRRSDLKQLIPYAKDVIDRKALTRLSSKDGKQEYKEKIVDSYKGIADLLTLCPSLTIPLEHFVSICKFLLPRYYTISSSSSVHPDRIHITVSLTEDVRKDGTKFQGVCSTYLGVSNPKHVRIFVRPSTFRLPKDPSKPIIMIGPGTGIAPMRALLQERRHEKLVQKKSPVGANILYFGCKNRKLDYLYQDELEQFEKDGILNKLYLAFSRESENGKKVYVQHLISQNAEETWKLIDDDGAYIYVCGGVKMGHDVTEALQEILSTQGQMSFSDAKDYLNKMASAGRFVQELWA